MSCQDDAVLKKTKPHDGAVSNNTDTEHAVPTRRLAKTALCQEDAVPIVCRVKTMSLQHGVVSRRRNVRRHRVTIASCQHDTVPKNDVVSNRRRIKNEVVPT